MRVSAEGRVEHQNEPKRPPFCGRLGCFGVQLDYSCRLKSVPACAENRVVGPTGLRSVRMSFVLSPK